MLNGWKFESLMVGNLFKMRQYCFNQVSLNAQIKKNVTVFII